MDKKGQLILLSGILIAMGVALVTLYLTTASISGYRVSYSPWDLPYYEMRMGVFEATRAVKLYTSKPTDIPKFYRNMSRIYARHGYFLVVNATPVYPYLYRLHLVFKTDRVYLEVKKNVTTY